MEWKREFEVYLTTYDGAQHLRLHGWLKRNKTTIKMEHHASSKDEGYFGGFEVYISENLLERLKEIIFLKGPLLKFYKIKTFLLF